MTTAPRLPRVLLVGPNTLGDRATGGGPALAALFHDWPRQDLAQIHSDPREPDPRMASSFYRLNDREERTRSRPLRHALRLLRFAAGRADVTALFFARITPRLRNWLERWQPEVVFSELGSLPMAKLSLEIARRYGIPLHLWIGDDWIGKWPASVIGRSIFPITHLADREMRRIFRRAMTMAASVSVISDEMADEYEKRYGRKCQVLHHGVDLDEWPVRDVAETSRPARLLYSGSILPYAQTEALAAVRDAVVALRAQGCDVELVLHTHEPDAPPIRAAFGGVAGVVVRSLVPRAELARTLAGADALVLPVNFDRVTFDFIRYTIPTKVAEYLACGTPVLYHGPADVAQARFLERYDCALRVTSQDPAELEAGITRIVADAESRQRLVRSARHAAEHEFDIHVLRARLRRTLVGPLAPGVH